MAAWLATWLLSRLIDLSKRSHGHLDEPKVPISRSWASKARRPFAVRNVRRNHVRREPESAMLVSSLGR
jgi:hypothetical protein